LSDQINSAYLQNFHKEYFLFLLPNSIEQFTHNAKLLLSIVANAGGFTFVGMLFSSILFVLGLTAMLRKWQNTYFIILIPLLLVIIAAAIQKFSLIERVILFTYPLVMIVLGFGLDYIKQKLPTKFKWAVYFTGIYLIISHTLWNHFTEKNDSHELTSGLDYILKNKGTGDEILVDCNSDATYLYYTKLHPNKEKWQTLVGAHQFEWGKDNYLEIAQKYTKNKCFYLVSGSKSEENLRHANEISKFIPQQDFFQYAQCMVFVFGK
jgi:hypothetical protein